MDEIDVFINQLKTGNLDMRRMAAEFLGEADDMRVIPPLLSALGDEAWQVRNAAVESLIRLQEKWSVRPLVDLLKHEDVSTRNSAMTALSKMGDAAVIPLIDLLDNDDIDTRIFAANTIGNLGSKVAIEALIKKLDDPDLNVQYAVVEAIGRIKDRKATKYLLKLLPNKSEWDAYPIVVALSNIADPISVDDFIRLLDNEILRIPAIEGLGNIGDIKGVKPLIDRLENTTDYDEITAIIISLFKIHKRLNHFAKIENNFYDNNIVKKSLRNIKNNVFVNYIEYALTRGNDEIREVLFVILPWLYIDFAVDKLIYLLTKQDYYYSVINCLRNIGKKAIPALLDEIHNDNEYIRSGIAESLILDIGVGERVVDGLLELTEDVVDIVKIAAINSLGIIASNKSVKRLKELLLDPNPEVRDAAVGALSIIGTAQVVDIMIEFLNSEDPEIKILSLKTLGIIDDKSVIDKVLDFVRDPNPKIRATAMLSLGNLARSKGSEIADIEGFKYVIYDEDPEVRESSIYALGKIYGSRVLEYLYNLIDDEDWVRYAAIQSIGKYGTYESVPYLLDLLEQEDLPYSIQIAVYEALGNIGDASIGDKLLKCFESDEPDVISAGINALAKIKYTMVKEQIMRILDSEYWDVIVSAVDLIAELEMVEARDKLIELLNSNKFDPADKQIVDIAIIKALAKLGGETSARHLVELLENDVFQVYVVKSLIPLLKNNANLMKELLKTECVIIRRLLVSIIGNGQFYDMQETVVGILLNDPMAEVRRSAVWTLGKLNAVGYNKVLIDVSKNDSDEFVREYANKIILKLAKTQHNQREV